MSKNPVHREYIIFTLIIFTLLVRFYAIHSEIQRYSIILNQPPCKLSLSKKKFHKHFCSYSFWMMPCVALRKMVLGDARSIHCDSRIADSVLFMTERLERLTQPELASRLTLNCVGSYIEPQRLQSISITVIDVSYCHRRSNWVIQTSFLTGIRSMCPQSSSPGRTLQDVSRS